MLRRLLLTALPKVLLSRLTGLLAGLPLPRAMRTPFFRWFARRYGVALEEIEGQLTDYRSLQAFFRRALRPDARPIGSTSLVWPCDGRIVTIGELVDGRIEQVKGHTYALADLLADERLAAQLEGGEQATIYLAPGDYHRVHAPFDGELAQVVAVPGTLFPVNGPAVRSIPRLFARNSRHVFHCRTSRGTVAAVVMVGAFNVGGTLRTAQPGPLRRGQELGRFGFGSTVIVLLAPESDRFLTLPPEQAVRMGGAASNG